MSMTYRDEIGRPLTSLEVDGNFRTLEDRVSTLGASIPDPQPPGIGEAPKDGKQYARQNGGWSVVVSSGGGGGGGGISHAPSDGNLYASSGGFWTAFVPGIQDAPSDGRIYARQSRGWVVAPTGGGSSGPGIAHLGQWTAQLDVKMYNLVEKDAVTFISRGDYGTGTPPPSFASDDYWLPLGLPSVFVSDAVTQRFYHQFTTADRTTKNRVSDILNDYETRLKAAADKLTDHENRIKALEANFAMS